MNCQADYVRIKKTARRNAMNKKISIVYPEVTGRIAPEIYGHFSEHIGGVIYDGLWVGRNSDVPNINGYRKDLVEKFKAINPPVLRWPGGCFAETYNWRDGIGKKRPIRPQWWTPHDNRYESNEFGTHEFFEFCELVGAKAYLAINVTSITPLEARDWLDYCLSPRGSTTLALEREANGRPEPFKIDFIGVGNENWGGGGNMTPEYYALIYRQFATVIDNVAKHNIPLIIGGANSNDYNWTRKITESVSTAQKCPSGMSFHHYSSRSGDCINYSDSEWYEMLTKAERMDELINRHYAVPLNYGLGNKMKLVIDEWGCWHPDGSGPSKGYNLFEQQSTMRDAMVSALTLNIFNNNADKILMANVAQLCNNLHALFLSGKEHLITTPTYHVFDMYKAHMGAECLSTLVTDNSGSIDKRISVSASKKDGKITLTAANYSLTEDVECEIDILGAGAPEKCSVTLLRANDVREHNTFDEPNTVIPTAYESSSASITIPHSSIVSVTFNIE